MPKGKGYTPSQIQAMRDEGVLSPSEIANIEKSRKVFNSDNRSKSITSSELSTLRDQGKLSPSEIMQIEKRGYKYFPDNP